MAVKRRDIGLQGRCVRMVGALALVAVFATACMASPEAIPTGAVEAPTVEAAPTAARPAFLPTPAPPEPTSTPAPTATPEPTMTLGELIAARVDAGLFVAELERFEALAELSDPDSGPWTLLVPSDAVLTLYAEVLETLSEDEQRVAITGHVIAGLMQAEDFAAGTSFVSSTGNAMTVDGDGLLPGGARIFGESQTATNGVLHQVDALVLPLTDSIDDVLIEGLQLLQPVLFEQQSAELTDAGQETLGLAADMLIGLTRPVIISIEGHADASETDATALTDARAQAARDFLLDRGVLADRLEVVGFGLAQPAGDDLVANRRVELVVLE